MDEQIKQIAERLKGLRDAGKCNQVLRAAE
jgi:hypothetical protein